MGQITVRLPDEFLAWIKAQAKKNKRSVNAEVELLLEQARRRRKS